MSATYQLDRGPAADGDSRQRDPHGIVPDGFYAEYDSIHDAAAEVEATADGPEGRCPDCGRSVLVEKRAPEGLAPGNRKPGRYRCKSCGAHFDEPAESALEQLKRMAAAHRQRDRPPVPEATDQTTLGEVSGDE